MFAQKEASGNTSGCRKIFFAKKTTMLLPVLTVSIVALSTLALQSSNSPVNAASPANTVANVTGLWKTHNGDLVRFYSCGKQLCGRLVKTRSAQRKDTNNTNPKLRNRSIKGLTIIRSHKKSGPAKWIGTVYNINDGITYNGSLTLTSSRSAELTGCMGGGLCRTATWNKISSTRVASN